MASLFSWEGLVKGFIIIIVLLVLISCGKIPLDRTPAPIDNDLWTLELTHNGKTDVGLLGAQVDFANPDDTALEIPIFHKGYLNIRSERCAYDYATRFVVKSPTHKKFPLKDLIALAPPEEFGCIFNVQLFIDGMDKGMQGQFYVQKKESYKPMAATILGREFQSVGWYQFRKGSNPSISIHIKAAQPGRLIYQGCGVKGDLSFDEAPTLHLADLFPEQKSCVITLGAKYLDGHKELMELNVKFFSKDVAQLQEPSLSFNGSSLKVTGFKPLAYVALDTSYKKGISVSKKVKDLEVVLRMITANGRYNRLNVKKGEIVWRPSILY